MKESRLINFEIVPSGPSKRPSYRPKWKAETVRKRMEMKQEVLKEEEENQQEDTERVAEKLMDELELLGIKCPRCGEKHVEQKTEQSDPDFFHLFCKDCFYEWKERND